MKLTAACVCVIHALTYLARREGKRLVTVETIAGATGLSRGILAKELQRLVHVGILDAVQSQGGGHRLGRPAREITLLEVIEVVDGPVGGPVPRFGGAAGRGLSDRLQAVWDGAAEAARAGLGQVTLADLAGED